MMHRGVEIRANTAAERVLEVLDLDGGWLTLEGLLLMLPHGQRRDPVNRALWRLRREGLVQSREVRMNEVWRRVEWKVVGGG